MNGDVSLKSILLLAANPKGTRGLRLQEEKREIKERLRLAGHGKTPIKSTEAARPRDIQQAMLDFKPQIVHFSGHGAGQEGLVFEDLTGQEKLVDSVALANFFRLFSNRVECVVLNACYSEFQAEAISRHIEYVIGMSQGIDDSAAIEFSIGFYSALGAGESIEFAYELGCSAIQLEGLQDGLTPVLYKQGKLLQIYIGNKFSKSEEEKHKIQQHDYNQPSITPSATNLVTSESMHRVPSDDNDSAAEKCELPPTTTVAATSSSEDCTLSGKDKIALELMNKLFEALHGNNIEIAVRMFEPIAHKSLLQNDQIDPTFRKNNFNSAFSRANLYKQPIEVIKSESTGRIRLGNRGDKEDGQEEKFTIARNEQLGGLDGSIRIFFPANGKEAKISGLSL